MSVPTVHHGDSREVLKSFADASIDAVVCDPPYALVSISKRFAKSGRTESTQSSNPAFARHSAGFMGQRWDTGDTAHDPAFWREVYRVLKPGAHVVAFAGTRTYHRLACAVEDAGLEIRDMIAWLYGSGFPKSHDVSKGIDKSRGGSQFDAVRAYLRGAITASSLTQKQIKLHLGYPEDSGVISHWVGSSQPGIPLWTDWQKLKPLLGLDDRFDDLLEEAEREVVGQKMAGIAIKGEAPRHTVGASRSVVVDITAASTDLAAAWEGWGTALKPALEPIVLARKPLAGTVAANVLAHGTGALNIGGCRVGSESTERIRTPSDFGLVNDDGWTPTPGVNGSTLGRWPANVCHDGSAEVLAAFPDAPGQLPWVSANRTDNNETRRIYGKFEGERVLPPARGDSGSAARFFYTAKADAEDRLGSKHPTVKPVSLMRWLCRLITPPGGTILDPFAGTGTTGLAAMAEGFDCILIEREDEYVADIRRRLAWARGEGRLTAQEWARRPAGDTADADDLFSRSALAPLSNEAG